MVITNMLYGYFMKIWMRCVVQVGFVTVCGFGGGLVPIGTSLIFGWGPEKYVNHRQSWIQVKYNIHMIPLEIQNQWSACYCLQFRLLGHYLAWPLTKQLGSYRHPILEQLRDRGDIFPQMRLDIIITGKTREVISQLVF